MAATGEGFWRAGLSSDDNGAATADGVFVLQPFELS
jgi:hypothetical protein